MSKSTSHFTSGQITFFLMAMMASGALFFYLGARFGAKINRATDLTISGNLLPDEKLDQEIEQMLIAGRQDLKFHQLLQNETPPAEGLKTDPLSKSLDRDALLKEHERDVKKEDAATPQPSPQPKTAPPQPSLENVLETPLEMTVPETATPPVDIHYRLQIGSYSEEAKAKADVILWQKRGYTAKVVKTNIAGKGTWYRLQIGGYSTMDEVKQAQGDVMKKYGKSPAIADVSGE